MEEIYQAILDKYKVGYQTQVRRTIGKKSELVWMQVYYPKKLVRKLTGKNPNGLEKWLERQAKK